MLSSRSFAAALAVALLAAACAAGDDDAASGDDETDVDAAPPPDGGSSLRMMTFNFKHAELSNLEDVAAAIDAEAPDVVALQEVDREAERSGIVDQPSRLAELTGMSSRFAAALSFGSGGEYGVALLSRWPIGAEERMELTSIGEQRILAVWQIELPGGGTMQLANTHLGLDVAERATQVAEVATVLAGRERVVLVGDLNEGPDGGSVYPTLSAELRDAWSEAGQGPGYTFPSLLPSERIDYIFLGSDWPEPTEARVVNAFVSDHRPLLAVIPLAP